MLASKRNYERAAKTERGPMRSENEARAVLPEEYIAGPDANKTKRKARE